MVFKNFFDLRRIKKIALSIICLQTGGYMQAIKLFLVMLSAFVICMLGVIASAKPLFSNAEEYRFYCGDTSKDCHEVKSDNAAADKAFLTEINGECALYCADGFDLDGFLKKYSAKIVFCEELSDSVNYYCEANLPYSVNLYGKRISLHICLKHDSVTVASPIIFGGY